MEIVQIIIITVVLVAIAVLGLATQILLKKGGKFPNTHVGGNKHLVKEGITCAKTQDKIDQAKINQQVDFKNLKIAKIHK